MRPSTKHYWLRNYRDEFERELLESQAQKLFGKTSWEYLKAGKHPFIAVGEIEAPEEESDTQNRL